jgi:hypothetical protein
MTDKSSRQEWPQKSVTNGNPARAKGAKNRRREIMFFLFAPFALFCG